KDDIKDGIEMVESSNAIFKRVNVADFMKNNKVAVANNINKNMSKDFKQLKEAVAAGKYTEATRQYGQVLSQCIACHTIIRGW
ncbi:MAG: cytochrome C, partial [Sulfurimonas sp.]|nr:cytochrome C [Sulfurimonas sp.]